MSLFKRTLGSLPQLLVVIIGAIIFWFMVMVAAIHFIAYRNTVYVENFSQNKFDMIEKGMSVQQVMTVLGEPLEIRNSFLNKDGGIGHSGGEAETGEVYLYTKPKKSTHFYQKMITFQNGIVEYKFSQLYYD